MTESLAKKTPSSGSKPRHKSPQTAAAEPQALNLGDLFGRALQTVANNRQAINALDGYNGNHGDNMVENLSLVTEALQSRESQPPADALAFASQLLQSQGRGGTSQYYASGLNQAAQQLQGQSKLDSNGVMTLVQSLMGAIPSEGFVEQPSAQESVLGSVLSLLGGAQAPAQPQQPAAQENVLGSVLGLLGGGQPQPQPGDDKLDAGDVLNMLLPAGIAFLQARQSGADTKAAAGQALISALMGGQVNPLQANSPRTAAGGLIVQSILQGLVGQK